jgi:hypothetical protein
MPVVGVGLVAVYRPTSLSGSDEPKVSIVRSFCLIATHHFPCGFSLLFHGPLFTNL